MLKKLSVALCLAAFCVFIFAACQPADAPAPTADTPAANTPAVSENAGTAPQSTPEQIQEPEKPDLTGHSLFIYCGAGMAEPFQKISDAFETQTGCKLEVTYANAAQIHTQIQTSQEGDMFVAGSEDEVKPIAEFVSSSKPLVKHIPVIAVYKDNPFNITGLSGLADDGVRVFLGDADSTPIGKIADKALKDAGIFDNVNIVSRTVTAPLISTALAAGECDATIVWKENCNVENVEIVDTADMEPYIKVIPAAALTFNKDSEALAELIKFLDDDTAKSIWTEYGYELAN